MQCFLSLNLICPELKHIWPVLWCTQLANRWPWMWDVGWWDVGWWDVPTKWQCVTNCIHLLHYLQLPSQLLTCVQRTWWLLRGSRLSLTPSSTAVLRPQLHGTTTAAWWCPTIPSNSLKVVNSLFSVQSFVTTGSIGLQSATARGQFRVRWLWLCVLKMVRILYWRWWRVVQWRSASLGCMWPSCTLATTKASGSSTM